MKNIKRLAIMGLLLSTVSACATLPSSADQTDWDSKAANQIDDRLSDAAERAAASSETLAQVERARTAPVEPSMSGADVMDMPPELQRPTTVEWTGPAAELVAELARNIGYAYSVVGDEPPVDVMVSVSAVDEPAVKVFEDIGYQVAKFAEVFVDPTGKRVEFRFVSEHQASAVAAAPKAPRLQAPSTQPTSVRRHKEPLGK